MVAKLVGRSGKGVTVRDVRNMMAGCLAVASWWLAAPALAQSYANQGFRLERLALAPTAEDGVAVTLPKTLGHLRAAGALTLSYVRHPFQLPGPPERSLVAQRLSADLTFALGLFDVAEAYGRLPFLLVGAGEDIRLERTRFSAPGGFALGDAALGGTADIYQFRDLRLGARAELLLPTGSQDDLMGDYAIAPRGHALTSYDYERFTFALEGGAVYRPKRDYARVRIGSEYEWVAATRFALLPALDLWVEAFGTRSARRPAEASALDTLDLLFSGRHRAPVGLFCLHTSASLGTGFSDAAGDPDLRVLFTVALTTNKEPENDTPKAHDALRFPSAGAPQKD